MKQLVNSFKPLIILLILFLAGCSSAQIKPETDVVRKKIDPSADYPIDIYDPWEGFNRTMYVFNAKFDRYIFIPVVQGYEAVMPDIAQRGVSNFFSNLGEINNVINSILQLKPKSTVTGVSRFVLNSTVGIFGLWDPASHIGLLEREEDFGQTLGVWGVGSGPYLVVPVLGPSSLRDVTGYVADSWFFDEVDPLNYEDNSDRELLVKTLSAVNTRHEVKFRYLNGGSPFEYETIRYLYIKKREFDVKR